MNLPVPEGHPSQVRQAPCSIWPAAKARGNPFDIQPQMIADHAYPQILPLLRLIERGGRRSCRPPRC